MVITMNNKTHTNSSLALLRLIVGYDRQLSGPWLVISMCLAATWKNSFLTDEF